MIKNLFIKISLISSMMCFSFNHSFANSIEETLVSTYNTNPTLLAQREELKLADEKIIEVIAEFLPDVRSNFGRSKNFESAKIDIDNPISLYNHDDYRSMESINLRQNLFNGGGSVIKYKSIKKYIESQRDKLKEVEQKIFLDAISAHINVLLSEHKLRIYKNSVDMLQKYLKQVEEQFSINDVTITDISQAKSKLSNAISEYIKAQASSDNAKSLYYLVTGIEAKNLSEIKLHADFSEKLDDIINIALRDNPSVKIAKRSIDIESDKIYAALTKFLPKLDLSASISKQSVPDYNINNDLKTKNKKIMLNLEVPIYQQGMEYQEVRQQRHQYRKIKNQSQSQNNQVIDDVTKIWNSITLSNSIIDSASDSVIFAKTALESIKKEASLGLRKTDEVLASEQQLLEAELNLNDANYNKIINIYKLKLQIGELTAQALTLSTPIYDPEIHFNKVKFKIIGF